MWSWPELAQDPRQAADVVLVAVGEHDRVDLVAAVEQVGEVGDDEVDAVHLGGGEADAHVDHDDAAVVLDDGHVLADLAQASEREDAEGRSHAAFRWCGERVGCRGVTRGAGPARAAR
jgi:hypothetical protein